MTPAIAIPSAAARTFRPGLFALTIVACDLVAVTASLLAALMIRLAWGEGFDPASYFRDSAAILLFPLAYGLFGQYSPVAWNTVREIRRLTAATTLVFVVFSVLLFLFKVGSDYSRAAFLVAWLLTLVTVPCARAAVRKLHLQVPGWGHPIAVLGTYDSARQLIEGLHAQPETGLRPTAAFLAGASQMDSILGVPVLGDFSSVPLYARRYHLTRAILALPDIRDVGLHRTLELHASVFSHVYLMPGLPGFSSFGVEAQDICGGVGLELRHSLLLPSCQFLKRLMDIATCAIVLTALLPLMLLIAVLIRLESPGDVLFGHRRIGHGGRKFKMWKFRTMYANGAEILKEYFEKNPAAQEYWSKNMKLRDDPRITPLGSFLRKTSLDELPQLWNILRGEMSLVGPRPIVNDEVAKYGESFGLYCRVIPGLTGLWQVSGRSTTTYERRVELDTYYVRNWSPWLDIYLLARTVRTVLLGEGAC